ncbi:MAG: TetR/AcrR family transcriptional regulator [Spirochaetes bacterium]|nr:TetR/AcrR family transcriptional regulator [Spirochaetota bacterium]MBN2772557.1 TetR/AcrR family transcriptional regulator [Spirochaetota bacterium]
MKKVNKADKIELKKAEILDALKRCLLKDVYSQISFNDVADEAGMSKGGVRHYFPTKESLFMGLIEDFFNTIEEEQINVIKAATKMSDKALLSTMYSIEKFLMNQDNVIIMMNIIIYSFEDNKIKELVRSFLRHHLQLFENLMKDLANDTNIDQNQVRQISRTIQVILLSTGIIQTLDPIEYDTNSMMRTVLSLLKMKI